MHGTGRVSFIEDRLLFSTWNFKTLSTFSSFISGIWISLALDLKTQYWGLVSFKNSWSVFTLTKIFIILRYHYGFSYFNIGGFVSSCLSIKYNWNCPVVLYMIFWNMIRFITHFLNFSSDLVPKNAHIKFRGNNDRFLFYPKFSLFSVSLSNKYKWPHQVQKGAHLHLCLIWIWV